MGELQNVCNTVRGLRSVCAALCTDVALSSRVMHMHGGGVRGCVRVGRRVRDNERY